MRYEYDEWIHEYTWESSSKGNNVILKLKKNKNLIFKNKKLLTSDNRILVAIWLAQVFYHN